MWMCLLSCVDVSAETVWMCLLSVWMCLLSAVPLLDAVSAESVDVSAEC